MASTEGNSTCTRIRRSGCVLQAGRLSQSASMLPCSHASSAAKAGAAQCMHAGCMRFMLPVCRTPGRLHAVATQPLARSLHQSITRSSLSLTEGHALDELVPEHGRRVVVDGGFERHPHLWVPDLRAQAGKHARQARRRAAVPCGALKQRSCCAGQKWGCTCAAHAHGRCRGATRALHAAALHCTA